MGKLERARIHVLNGDGSSSTDFEAIEVCFNPKEYSLDKSVSWDAEKAFSDAPQPEFKAPTPMELSVTLQFDTYEERTNVRDKWVRKIEKLALMTGDLPSDGSKASKSDKQKFRPPTILFIWGRFSFKGVVESLSQKYTMFLSDGTPVRAECALKIRNVLDKKLDDDNSQSWSGDTQTRTVPVGPNDRLDLIAAKELGDAGRWAEIAALNGVVDPGAITDGNGDRMTQLEIPRELVMPSLQIDCAVKLGTKEIGGDEVHDVLVEADLDQPDHSIITLSNLSTKYSEQVTEGDDIEVKLGFIDGKDQGTVFKGEVVGIEPVYDAKAPARVHIRGYNQLHRLMRGKKSVTYTKVTDKDIVDKLCQQYGLTADYGDTPPSTKYDHVYQHNLTDLEFVRMRAARLGFEVSVDDKKLYFRKRVDSDSGIKLVFGVSGDSALERFMPRLSTAQQVSEVKVFGWDPVKKQEIVGSAKPQSSKLGDTHGSSVANDKHKDVLQVVHERPVASKEEADNIAKSILNDRMMEFITGDGVCRGNPDIKPGIILTINVQDQRFDGKYHIIAVRHRYIHSGSSGGYRTEFKFRRDAKSDSS